MLNSMKSMAGTITRPHTAFAVVAATLLVGGTATEASAKSRYHHHHYSHQARHVSHASSQEADTSTSPFAAIGRVFSGLASFYGNESGRDVAAGVIDVKSSHVETADEVARRIDAILATGVPPNRLTLVPDCGFSQTARHLAVPKLHALVDGRNLVAGRGPTSRPAIPEEALPR